MYSILLWDQARAVDRLDDHERRLAALESRNDWEKFVMVVIVLVLRSLLQAAA